MGKYQEDAKLLLAYVVGKAAPGLYVVNGKKVIIR